MLRLLVRLLPVLVAALITGACDDDNNVTPTAPTPPSFTTSTFDGVVNRNGAQIHTFASGASGQVTATLKFVVPDNTVKLGLALGTWNNTSCQLVIARTDATEGTSVVGAVSALGTLCVYVHDVGNLTQPAEYQLEVTYPS
jgi:hypothetical protein